MNKTYEHKYKLGERVWIKSPDDIEIEVCIESVCVEASWGDEFFIKYTGLGGDDFYEDDVIDKKDNYQYAVEISQKEMDGFLKWRVKNTEKSDG